MNYKLGMRMLKYILLFIFSAVSIEKSLSQNIVPSPKVVKIYFQSVSYTTQQSIASRIVIYDTYYNKIDSIAVPKEGLYLNLPKIDLIFKVRPNDKIYRTKKMVFYADELKDSLQILIDPKTIDRCPISIRNVFFKENSYELDSLSIVELRNIKKDLLIFDDSSHCLIIEIHSHIDVLEKTNAAELVKK
jgi:hypothetical protein